MQKPYIGVTGITTVAEASRFDQLAASIPNSSDPKSYRPMAGVLVSGRTMSGEVVPSRRYPPVGHLRAITDVLAHRSFTTVHFNTRVTEPLDEQVSRVLDIARSAHGVQLNVVCPDPDALARLKSSHPDLEIILQINGSSVSRVVSEMGLATGRVAPSHLSSEDLSSAITTYLQRYAGLADHALIDLSGGQGRSINVDLTASLLPKWLVVAKLLSTRLGVAGGLGGPDTEFVLSKLTLALPESSRHAWSVDAESRVRKPAENPIEGESGQDDLDLDAVAQYLKAAATILNPVHRRLP